LNVVWHLGNIVPCAYWIKYDKSFNPLYTYSDSYPWSWWEVKQPLHIFLQFIYSTHFLDKCTWTYKGKGNIDPVTGNEGPEGD